ncbi:MAG: hypothetical protein HY283_09405 [Nitrospirae bacterium]|nr:hypothetical protein [Nitrospirota bacterium]
MTQPIAEKEIFSNEFGTVTDRRVIYFRNKGWFRGGSREDVPIKHVTSVRVDIARHPILGGALVLLSLYMFYKGAGMIMGLLVGCPGLLLLWGFPTVVVNTAGRDLRGKKGWPWHRKAAEGFAEALRSQLFHD